MAKTKIEWATHSWNPVTGCTPISEGCENCYARRMAKRLAGRCGYPAVDPFRATIHPERLDEPFRWKKPRRVFVCSMSDLFHKDVPDEFVWKVFDVMFEAGGDKHIYLILTKRPERMHKFIRNIEDWDSSEAPHIWLGVTAENQQRADERIPILLQIPAAVRFVSVEPMLGLVDLTGIRFDRNTIMNVLEGCGINRLSPCQSIPNAFCEKIDWVICGGETGPGARPMHPDWVRSLRDQCQDSGVPFFFKQWGEFEYLRQGAKNGDGKIVAHKVGKKRAGRLLDGREWNEMPEVGVHND